MEQVIKLIKSLNLIYYELDFKKNIIQKDENYSNFYSSMEFTKITYLLSQKHIPFKVLKDKSINLNVDSSLVHNYLSTISENIKNFSQNIYILNNEKIKWVKNIPLFKIIPTNKNINLDDYDVIIFTSKNAIDTINKINPKWKKIPSYVISEQTAKRVKDLDGKVEFISKEKHGNEFAYEMLELLKGKKVIYLRAKDMVSDLINILKENGINCHDEIVYESKYNEEVKKIKIPKNSKIIFTSPSTVKYFFKTFTWDDSYKAISIGKTTASFFPKNIKAYIAQNTSFKSCVHKALEIN